MAEKTGGGDVFHLIASARIRVGYVSCGPGEPLCGTPAPLHPLLLPPEVTCHRCAAIAARDHIGTEGAGAA